jgi:hypothetical protein
VDGAGQAARDLVGVAEAGTEVVGEDEQGATVLGRVELVAGKGVLCADARLGRGGVDDLGVAALGVFVEGAAGAGAEQGLAAPPNRSFSHRGPQRTPDQFPSEYPLYTAPVDATCRQL